MKVWSWPYLLVRSPLEFFQCLREKWPWIPAYVMAVVCTALGTALTMTAVRGDLQRAFQEAGVPDLGNLLTGTALIVGSILGALVAPLVLVFAYSFAASFLGLLFRRFPDYGKLYSLVMWCYLPSFTLGSLVRGTMIALNPGLIQDLTFSPAAFVARETLGNQLYRVLGTLDLFQIVFYMLFTVGYATITKLEVRKSAVISGALYGMQVLVVIAFTT